MKIFFLIVGALLIITGLYNNAPVLILIGAVLLAVSFFIKKANGWPTTKW